MTPAPVILRRPPIYPGPYYSAPWTPTGAGIVFYGFRSWPSHSVWHVPGTWEDD